MAETTLELFAYSWSFTDEEEGTIIKISGYTEKNENVFIHVQDFTPHLYVELPEGIVWTAAKIEMVKKHMMALLGGKNQKPISIEYVQRRKSYYAHKILNKEKVKEGELLYGDKKFPFLKCLFLSAGAVKNFSYRLKNNQNILGIGNLKYKCHENDTSTDALGYGVSPVLRLLAARKLPAAGWIRVTGMMLDEDEKESLFKYEMACSYKNLFPGSKQTIIRPKVGSWDIEANSTITSAMPDANKPKDEVFQISYISDLNGVGNEYLLTLGNPDPKLVGKNVIIRKFKTEAELLVGFTDLIIEDDPNVLIGYNILGWDMKYMIARARYRKVLKQFDKMGCLEGVHSPVVEPKFSSKAHGAQALEYLDAEGRLFIDLLPVIKRDHKITNYRLNTVSEHFKVGSKDPLTPQDIFAAYRAYRNNDPKAPQMLGEVGKYCLQDARVTLALYKKLQMWFSLCEMAKTAHVPIFFLFSSGTQIQMYSQVIEYTFYNNYVNISNGYTSPEGVVAAGATVLTPVAGKHNKVLSFDFASLYPSIMMRHNIDYTTFVQEPPQYLIGRYDNGKYQEIWDDFPAYVKMDDRGPEIQSREEKYPETHYWYEVADMDELNDRITEIKNTFPLNLSTEMLNFTGWDETKKYTRSKVMDFCSKYVKENKLTVSKNLAKADPKFLELINYISTNTQPLTNERLKDEIQHHFLNEKMIIIQKHASDIPDEHTHIFEWEDHAACQHDDGRKKLKNGEYSKAKAHVICGVHRYRFMKEEYVGKGIIPTLLANMIGARKKTRGEIKNNELVMAYHIYVHYRDHPEDLENKELRDYLEEIKGENSKGVEMIAKIVEDVKKEYLSDKELLEYYKELSDYLERHKKYPDCTLLKEFIKQKKNKEIKIWYQENTVEKLLIFLNDLDMYNQVLDKRQASYKICANSMYGAMGVKKGFLPLLPGSMSVCYKGRCSIGFISTFIPKKYNGKTVYGDTDSAHILFPHVNDNKTAVELALTIIKDMENYFTSPMKLEFEKVYEKYIILTKKRYMALVANTDGVITSSTKKGVCIQRRDNCKVLKIIYTKVKDMLLEDKSEKEILDVVLDGINEMFQYRYNYKDFVITKGLTKSEYKGKTPPAHSYIAQRMIKRGMEVGTGSRIEYIFTTRCKHEKKIHQGKKAEDIDYYKRWREYLRIDHLYYMEKQLIKPLDELLYVGLGVENFMKNQYELRRDKEETMEKIKAYGSPMLDIEGEKKPMLMITPMFPKHNVRVKKLELEEKIQEVKKTKKKLIDKSKYYMPSDPLLDEKEEVKESEDESPLVIESESEDEEFILSLNSKDKKEKKKVAKLEKIKKVWDKIIEDDEAVIVESESDEDSDWE